MFNPKQITYKELYDNLDVAKAKGYHIFERRYYDTPAESLEKPPLIMLGVRTSIWKNRFPKRIWG